MSHSNNKIHHNDISDIRSNLKSINIDIFKLFIKRRELVLGITKLKKELKNDKIKNNLYFNYDVEREYELFISLKDELKELTWEELLAFSVLIEGHADAAGENYPRWTSGKHLNSCTVQPEILKLINPLIVKIVSEKHFKQFKLIGSLKLAKIL